VILLFLESWSGRYAGALRPDGQPFTPIFDEQRRKGLSYDRFYGNSVQSSRGHFASLCSLVPMVRGRDFIDIPGTRLHCLPEVLRSTGYRTSFHSASDEPDFDSARVWLSRVGFDDVRFAPDRNVTTDAAMWGVGIQDDVFYTRVFADLDEKVAREPGVPQFVVLANASHHYPFDKSPGHVPDPGYPTKYARNFVASLRQADAWLATFYAELERRPALRESIVVVVGDHSFPADEHGIHFSGLGSFEEAFRTAFTLRWTGHVPPELVTDRAASQIDLAPTVVDLLQIRARTHFTGSSLVAGESNACAGPSSWYATSRPSRSTSTIWRRIRRRNTTASTTLRWRTWPRSSARRSCASTPARPFCARIASGPSARFLPSRRSRRGRDPPLPGAAAWCTHFLDGRRDRR
jgi:phosphoglycerol transferase MdoB-like AlkP superfamily enzyme